MKKYRMTTLCLAVAATFAHAGNVMAQSDDGVLLAYESSQKDSITTADDEIFAALQALDEVGAIIKAENQEGKSQPNTQNDKVDVDALLAAVNQPAQPMKSFRVDDPMPDMSEQAAPKHDIQTAPAKVESIAAVTKHDIQMAPAKVESLAAAPKHDIQTAPAKVESLAAAPKHDIQTAPAKSESLAAAPKHDIQTAPAKVESLAAAPKHDIQPAPAKVESLAAAPKHDIQTVPAKSESIAAAPKHDIQTAPAKSESLAAAPKHDIQTAPAKVESLATAPKHDIQTAPAKVQSQTVAKSTSQPTSASPAKSAANPPQNLSLAYVMAVYQTNGVDLSKLASKKAALTIAELYQHAFTQKLVYQSTKPAVGDLAFFHNTNDRNRDGRWNDWHSLIGIVESIDSDETISVLVYQKDKIERIMLNLKYPELQKGKKGQILNSQLRANEGAHKGTAAKLFAGFANLLGDVTSVTVIDNWKPGMKITQ